MRHSLFPTLVMEENLNRSFTNDELNFIMNMEKVQNHCNSLSRNKYVLEQPEMKDIKIFAEKSVTKYIEEIICPLHTLKVHITQSWLNFTSKGESHHKHSHPNSYLSGVLYIQADEKYDKILFYNDKFDSNFLFRITSREYGEYYSPAYFLPAKTGRLYIFSSNLVHEVPENLVDKTRISLSFNTFVTGKMGEEDELDGLNLFVS